MSTLERLYDAHAQAMFAFTLELTRDEADTADILQAVFYHLAKRPSLLRGIRNERAFLLRMVYSRVIDSTRRRKVRLDHANCSPDLAQVSPVKIMQRAMRGERGLVNQYLELMRSDPQKFAVSSAGCF